MPKRKVSSNTKASANSITPKKRESPEVESSLATRSSKRLRTSVTGSAKKDTPTKSKYFEQLESEEEATGAEDDSGYDEEQMEAGSSASEEESDEYDSESDNQSRKRSRPKTKQKGSATTIVKTDLWREGVKTGLGPGKQVFIQKPKPRGDGGIKYVPEKIHPHTLEFLKDLKNNNDRVWLKAHDPDYRQSWKDFEGLVETLTEKIAEVDETIPELPPKDLVFRIYRDVRFSSDPTPYKTHFSAAWSRTGRKGPYACYYVHIQPGNRSFVGSGLWHPDAAPLALLRQDIDQQPDRIMSVLMDTSIRKGVFGGIANDKKKAIKAFTVQNAENALKTKPKGYDADHPNIELLRLRNFTIGQKISDTDLVAHGLDKIMELVRTMHPFVTYLNSVVMPDDEDQNGNDAAQASSDDSASVSASEDEQSP